MKEKRTETKNVALLTGAINTEIFNNTGNKICDVKECFEYSGLDVLDVW